MSVKKLGKKLLLDSGTLTPLLKNLEKKELVKRVRSKEEAVQLYATLRKKLAHFEGQGC
nr:MarR family transcriptional regulator [uncultured Treponema sp.]